MKHLDDVGALFAGLGAGTTIVLHSACAEPRGLARQLAEHASAMRGVHVYAMMPMGSAPYSNEAAAAELDIATFFPGRGLRAALDAGRVRPLRYPVSAIPGLFDSGTLKADVLLLQVSPPDATGQVSLGVSVDYMHAVLRQAPLVVAEVNPRMPQTCGDTAVPVSSIDWFVEATEPPEPVPPAAADEVGRRIAEHVASLVQDGAVIQIGVGSLPDMVLARLGHLRHLGLHSGMITDAVRPLIESGVIDNSTKKRFAGVCVTTMAAGTQDFYDFLHRNAAVEFHPCSLTHGASVVASIENLCAINSVLQVDLAGRGNAETVDGRCVALPGGLPDFAAGATRVPGGRSILALRSAFRNGTRSNIVAHFAPDAPTTVGPEHVDFVVTEYGIAAVRGLAPAARARALISVAHPNHREALERQCVGPLFSRQLAERG